jgi:hypothetical protein
VAQWDIHLIYLRAGSTAQDSESELSKKIAVVLTNECPLS